MGKEMYVLHDNGRSLFTSARECTPIQRFVYTMARNHHEDEPDTGQPSELEKAGRLNNTASKVP